MLQDDEILFDYTLKNLISGK